MGWRARVWAAISSDRAAYIISAAIVLWIVLILTSVINIWGAWLPPEPSPAVRAAAVPSASVVPDDPMNRVATTSTAPHHFFKKVLLWTKAPRAHIYFAGQDLGEVPVAIPRPTDSATVTILFRAPGYIDRELTIWARSPNKVQLELDPEVDAGGVAPPRVVGRVRPSNDIGKATPVRAPSWMR